MAGLSRAYKRRPKGLPLSIPGLQLWLDASDASTLFQNSNGTTAATADGDPVGYWADKSGNGRNATQSDGTKKPALKIGIQNGRSTVLFDGTSDVLNFSFAQSYGYAWFVYIYTGSSQYATLLSRNIGPGLYATLNYNAQPGIYWYKGGAGSDDVVSSSVNVTAAKNVRFSFLSATESVVINETTTNSKTLSSSPLGNWSNVGAPASTNQAYKGHICEIVIASDSVTNTDITTMNAYLMQKWGIT